MAGHIPLLEHLRHPANQVDSFRVVLQTAKLIGTMETLDNLRHLGQLLLLCLPHHHQWNQELRNPRKRKKLQA